MVHSLFEAQDVGARPVFSGDVDEVGFGVVGDSVENGFVIFWSRLFEFGEVEGRFHVA